MSHRENWICSYYNYFLRKIQTRKPHARAIPRRTLSNSPLKIINLSNVVSKLVDLRSPARDLVSVTVTREEEGEGADEDRLTPRELSKEQSFQPVLDIILPLEESSAFKEAIKDEAAGGTRAASEDGSGE
jgi:hypothetical protein